jgi:hypothetical protein
LLRLTKTARIMFQANPLLIKFKRFVKHRERMMTKHGARMTIERMTTVSKLLRICDLNANSNQQTIARIILLQEDRLRTIMPGRISEFYEGDYKKLNEIISECNEFLNQTTN